MPCDGRDGAKSSDGSMQESGDVQYLENPIAGDTVLHLAY